MNYVEQRAMLQRLDDDITAIQRQVNELSICLRDIKKNTTPPAIVYYCGIMSTLAVFAAMISLLV